MLPTTTGPVHRGEAEALDPREPQPGGYWRARMDVPAATRVEHDQDRWSDRLTTREVTARAAVPAGTLLLLRTVHKVEGRVHTLVTAGDPNRLGDPARDWLLADFLDALEPVDEAEAAALRAAEVGAAAARIGRLQEAMLAIAAEAAAPIPALPPPAAAPSPEALGESRERATALAALAGERARRIQEVNADLVAEMQLVNRLQGERAAAALAAVQDALDAAERARKATESLDLFGGEAVEVIRLRDGAPAPDGTPVSLFQNRLYLDEELAVHLHQEGFDATHLPALGRIVAERPGVVERMVPAPRGVVLVRVRRNAKRHFGPDAPMAAIYEAMRLQKLDREQFLLVRDGERLNLVFTETALQDAERLFPTRDELDRPFRGASGAEQIRFDDTRFVKALGEFERQALVYKRLLVLLWGLEFGPDRPLGRIDPEGRPGLWHDPAWQARHLAFIADDATRSLPDAAVPVLDYLAANAALLQPGARVLVDWSRAITPDTAPACAYYQEGNYGERVHVTHRPEAAFSIHTARLQGGRCVVEVPVRKLESYHKGKAAFTARVELGAYDGERAAFLVLDGLDEDTLSRYCESRIHRVHYLDYLGLFTQARRALKEEFTAVRASEARAAAALAPSAPAYPAQAVAAAVATAHRMWRAEHGAALPTTERQEREIRDAAFLILSGTPTPEAIAAIAGCPGAELLLAGITGRGHLVAVTAGPDDPLLAPGTWVRRRSWVPARDGRWTPRADTVGTLPRAAAPSIAVTIRSPALARHVAAARLPEGIGSPDDTRAILDKIRLATPEAVRAAHCGPVDPGRLVESWFATAWAMTFKNRPAYTERRAVVEPWPHTIVGAFCGFRADSRTREPRIGLLTVVSDPLARALLADPAMAERLSRETGALDKDGEPVREGLLERLWRQGRHRLERAQGRAARMAAEPGARDDGHPFWLSTLEDPRLRGLALAAPGPTVELGTDHPLGRAWDTTYRPELGDWNLLMGRADMPVRSGGSTEIDGRLVVRAETWAWLSDLLGWHGARPANLDLVQL